MKNLIQVATIGYGFLGLFSIATPAFADVSVIINSIGIGSYIDPANPTSASQIYSACD